MPLVDLRDLMCSTVIFVHESHGAGDKTVPVPKRHHMIQDFIVIHVYICNFFVTKINVRWQYSMATQCFAMLRGVDFLPYKHLLMGILLCLCHTHLSRNFFFTFEVIVLCLHSVEGIMPILGVIQCIRVCQHKSTDETTVSRRHTIVKMQQRKRKPSKSHCKRLKCHI